MDDTVDTTAATHSQSFLAEVAETIAGLDDGRLERMAARLARARDEEGRVFFVGVGGGAANASHAVNDFRKIAEIEAYAPCDNVAELTARTNDDGWETSLAASLRVSRLGPRDVVFVFSVTGGREGGTSPNVAAAVRCAEEEGATVMGVVGDPDGVTGRAGDHVLVVTTDAGRRTPFTEAVQMVVSHLLVTHPQLARRACA
jgi:D-sedoheptulose 7-phosphate isomerase